MEKEILKKISENLESGISSAMVTITNSNGSIPGKKGAIMGVFSEDDVIGTVGGGKVEHKIILDALNCIETGEDMTFDFDMGDKAGLACGGNTKGFIKVFKANKKLVIFGGGHVARKIAKLSEDLEFDVIVIDDRGEYAVLEDFTKISEYIPCQIKDAFDAINFDKNTYVVVTTRSHTLDQEVLKYLSKYNVAYTGMIGSRAKVIKVKKNLIEDGVSEEYLNNIFAPVGLRIDNGTPEEIAISIISQVLMVKNNASGEVISL